MYTKICCLCRSRKLISQNCIRNLKIEILRSRRPHTNFERDLLVYFTNSMSLTFKKIMKILKNQNFSNVEYLWKLPNEYDKGEIAIFQIFITKKNNIILILNRERTLYILSQGSSYKIWNEWNRLFRRKSLNILLKSIFREFIRNPFSSYEQPLEKMESQWSFTTILKIIWPVLHV